MEMSNSSSAKVEKSINHCILFLFLITVFYYYSTLDKRYLAQSESKYLWNCKIHFLDYGRLQALIWSVMSYTSDRIPRWPQK